jgi:UDP-3-O-[3-hydroxymyristoyl] N-acetylglucosamine deacetylase
MLDVIGDLALVGHPIVGHLVVHRGGHALHTAMAIELLKQTDVWQFVGVSEGADRAARVRIPASQPLAN